MPSLFDQLKKTEVPPAPPKLERAVHRRINHRLTWLHMLDFALRTLPFAMAHFMAAFGGLVWYTVSGKFPPTGEKPRDENDSAGD